MGKHCSAYSLSRILRVLGSTLVGLGLLLSISCTKGTPNVQSLGKSLDPISLYNVVGSTIYITSAQPEAPIRGTINDKRIQTVVVLVEDQLGLLKEFERISLNSSKISGSDFATNIPRSVFPKPSGFSIAIKGETENGETQLANYTLVQDDMRFATALAPVAEIFNRTLSGAQIPTRNLNFVVKTTNEVPGKIRYMLIKKDAAECPADMNLYTNLIEDARAEFAIDISRLADGTLTSSGFDGVVRVCIVGGSDDGYFPSGIAIQTMDIPVDTLAPLLDGSSYLEATNKITTGLTKTLDVNLFLKSGEVANSGGFKTSYQFGYYFSEAECLTGNNWQQFQDEAVTVNLLNANLENRLFIKLQDPSGNKSQCRELTIIHDGLAPGITSATLSGNSINSAVEQFTLSTKETSKSWSLIINEELIEAKIHWEASDMGLTSGIPCSGTGEDLQNLQIGRYDSSIAMLSASSANYVCFALTDKAGNQTIRRYKVMVDNSGPVVTIANSNTGVGKYISAANLQSYLVTGSCEYGATKVLITMSAINGDFGPVMGDCSESGQFSIEVKELIAFANEGSLTFKASQQDLLGNESNQAAKVFTKDTVAPVPGTPVVDFGLGGNNYTNLSSLSGSIQVSNIGINGKMKISQVNDCSDGSWVSYSSSANFDLPAEEQVYNFYLRFKDEAGNISDCAAAPALTKDAIAPVVAITSPAVDAYVLNATTTSFVMNGTCGPPDGQVSIVRVSSGAVLLTSPCDAGAFTATVSGGIFANGSFDIKAMQTDLAGNNGFVTRRFKKDTVVPNMNFSSPVDSDWVTNIVQISGSCDEEGANVLLTASQSTFERTASGNCSGGAYLATVDVTDFVDGNFTVAGVIKDAALNMSNSISLNLKRDATPPNVVGLNVQFNDRRLNDNRLVATLRTDGTPVFALTGAATDSASGFNRYEISLGTSPAVRNDIIVANSTLNIGPHQLAAALAVGNQYYLQFRAYDNVGNYSIVNAEPFSVVACPTNYIKVSPETGFTHEPFCVAKFEMRDVAGVATSQSSGLPFVNLSRPYATSECAELDVESPTRNVSNGLVPENDSRFSLIANDHWMAVARKIERNSVNWMNYGVAGAHLFMGHFRTDFAQGYSLVGITNSSDSYSDIPSQDLLTPLGYSRMSLKRTLEVENGQMIWDFNGNAGELLRTTSLVGAAEAVPTAQLWRKIDRGVYSTAVSKFGPSFFPWVSSVVTDSLDYGLGSVLLTQNHATLYRGYAYRSNTDHNFGIYSLRSDISASYTHQYVGFRCVYEPLKVVDHGY